MPSAQSATPSMAATISPKTVATIRYVRVPCANSRSAVTSAGRSTVSRLRRVG